MPRRYYTGYAQFFDATTNDCDSVSWHIWLGLFTRQYLTQANRQRMNDLVISVNSKISAAVQRAGDQVVFIEYDDYVGFLGGRYCLPGVNEDKGQGANRGFLFFYESKTVDTPFMPPNDDPYSDELRRRNTSPSTVAPVNTTDGQLGSWMQQTMEQNSYPALNDDVANSDLDTSVANEEKILKARKRSPLPLNRLRDHEHAGLKPYFYPRAQLSSWNGYSSSLAYATGSASGASAYGSSTGISTGVSKASSYSIIPSSGSALKTQSPLYTYHSSAASVGFSGLSDMSAFSSGAYSSRIPPTGGFPSGFYSAGASDRTFPTGTANANGGLFLHKGSNLESLEFKPKEDFAVLSYFIPDSTSRVFHPQQGGHAMIANLIMYTMAARTAKSMGQTYAPQNLTDIGASCPLPPSPACNGSSSDTWAARDAAISAASSFCSGYSNLAGSTGKTTSGTFNQNSLDYLSISVNWNDDISIGENECNAWFETVIDGCDTTGSTKHGGSIGFAANATLSVDPLVVRWEWDGGQATAHQCNSINNNNYVTRSTLAANVQDFCTASASHANGIGAAGSNFTQDYNANTPNHVTLVTTWPPGPLNFQIFSDECKYYMGTIMDGCDVPNSAGSNPMNWKHGGTMNDHNGVSYTITPNANRASPPNKPLGNCVSWYKVLFATFDVYGGGWADSDFGNDPGGVLTQLKGCGKVTKWSFQYYDTPASDGTEWHASGRLPIGTGRCVSRAVASSGGFSAGCSGNG